MRRLLFCLVFLAAACIARASSTVGIILNLATQGAAPGDTLTFSGVLASLGPNIVDLNGLGVNVSGQLVTDTTPFFAGAPLSMNAGDTSNNFEFFTVLVPYSASLGMQFGTVTILGGIEGANGYDSTTQNILGQTTFKINVASVPEPASFGLLLLGVFAGGGVLCRRTLLLHAGNVSRRLEGILRVRRGDQTCLRFTVPSSVIAQHLL